MLRKDIASDQANWDSPLPMLMLAYRSCIYESTGKTAAAIRFGQAVSLPIYLMLGSSSDKNTSLGA